MLHVWGIAVAFKENLESMLELRSHLPSGEKTNDVIRLECPWNLSYKIQIKNQNFATCFTKNIAHLLTCAFLFASYTFISRSSVATANKSEP